MTTTGKLFLIAIAAAALAAGPAMARTPHVVQTHRSIEHAARGQVEPVVSPTYNYQSEQFLITEGYQRDRQMVGHGTGGGPGANE
jgi:hypothetical protein